MTVAAGRKDTQTNKTKTPWTKEIKKILNNNNNNNERSTLSAISHCVSGEKNILSELHPKTPTLPQTASVGLLGIRHIDIILLGYNAYG